ncbi:hypothetical protein [Sinomonas sp.]|uniref:hypothetical protein n=1 Tax=Sinomonas sp. TaxID=1914986 RepID=UPI002FE3FB5F
MGAPTRARWQRRRDLPGIVASAVLAGMLVSVVAGLSVGAWLATGRALSPIEVGQGLMDHRLEFTGLYPAAMGGVFVALALAVPVIGIWWRRTMVRPAWVDVAAQHMASPKEAASLTRRAVAKKARELGVKGAGR